MPVNKFNGLVLKTDFGIIYLCLLPCTRYQTQLAKTRLFSQNFYVLTFVAVSNIFTIISQT